MPTERIPDKDTMAPSFGLLIENNNVSESIRELINSVEYESVDGMADALKLTLTDVIDQKGNFKALNSKIFMPGNAISLELGYGPKLRHVGSAIIRRVRPVFPADGPPKLEVVAYTADSLMSDSSPEALKEVKNLKRKVGHRIKNAKAGRKWSNAKYSHAVKERAEAYGFETDIDDSPEPPSEFIQKARMTDLDFVQGLANLIGYVFWVDGAPSKERGGVVWTLHFRDPYKLKNSELQEKEYTLVYNNQNYGTLLDFEGELAIQESITKLKVESKDPLTGRWFSVAIEEQDDDVPDTKVATGNVRGQEDIRPGTYAGRVPTEGGLVLDDKAVLGGPLSTSSSLRIFIEDYSFDVRANRRFRSGAEMAAWAAAWFRMNRENFMLGRGTTVGIEDLRAMQQHNLKGLGVLYDGKYQFTRVRHIFDGSGYRVDFSARKVVPQIEPVTTASEVQAIEFFAKLAGQ
jgi:phage protein D